MRLNKKITILKLLTAMEAGIDYAKNNEKDTTKEILNGCIDSLLYLSNSYKDEIKLTENVKKISDKITSTLNCVYDNNLLKNSLNVIKEMFNNLRDIILNEIDTQIEVAFMPYKVSMWDSLESIWKEVNSDKNCSCHVVPIPYYEKNSNGGYCKLCYEGDDFPKDIEITHYNLYDFEDIKPEIIYIHNPYDDCNVITTVKSRYFSSNLSKYTNMLVYVPYYVEGSFENVDEFKVFSQLPGALNATKVIAQSAIHKDLFVANGHNPEKILNLGSPKLDATLLACKENTTMHSDFNSISKHKKVFLFNSTIDDILRDANWVKSVENILNYFINNDSCSVIWRPHPLTDITIKTMRPQLFEEYMSLKNKIASCPNIIIDLNKDIYPSMKISDALITGYSSIMFQYMITKKPILALLDKDRLNQNRYFCVDYLGCYFTNDGTNIYDFIEMVVNEQDPKKEERMNRFMKSMSNIDSTCGKKVHETIKMQVLDLLSS